MKGCPKRTKQPQGGENRGGGFEQITKPEKEVDLSTEEQLEGKTKGKKGP